MHSAFAASLVQSGFYRSLWFQSTWMTWQLEVRLGVHVCVRICMAPCYMRWGAVTWNRELLLHSILGTKGYHGFLRVSLLPCPARSAEVPGATSSGLSGLLFLEERRSGALWSSWQITCSGPELNCKD